MVVFHSSSYCVNRSHYISRLAGKGEFVAQRSGEQSHPFAHVRHSPLTMGEENASLSRYVGLEGSEAHGQLCSRLTSGLRQGEGTESENEVPQDEVTLEVVTLRKRR